ncbi:hypothetical protein J6590_096135 [Homalodisca vitripennis]|nr:hypothetical protein J6590_096135 [Homalodisca vitripennis]
MATLQLLLYKQRDNSAKVNLKTLTKLLFSYTRPYRGNFDRPWRGNLQKDDHPGDRGSPEKSKKIRKIWVWALMSWCDGKIP